jgi:putative membrane protein (TIGR04086 family)
MEKIKSKYSMWWGILRGALTAVSVSLVMILLFALFIKFFNISDNLILSINQGIKIVSIFIGSWYAFNRYNKSGGFIKGVLVGIIYTILAYSIFSILAGRLSFTLTSLTDLFFGGIIGGICGIIVVNLKK